MLAKAGLKIIYPLLLLSIIVIVITIFFPFTILKYLSISSSLLLLFSVWFFRDPVRNAGDDDAIVVSPADGRIVAYDEIEDDFVGNAKVISIFMSVFNVHVNRMPADGTIVSEDHVQGTYLSAYNPAASYENERRRINIDGGEDRKYGVTQIAGMIARRIVPYLGKGATAKKGDKFGMIMFGSKVDILMPADIVVQVKLNQRVKAGKTVLGIYK